MLAERPETRPWRALTAGWPVYPGAMVSVRATTPGDAAWIRSFLDQRWGGQEQVANGERYRPGDLPGFVAEADGQIVGYAALRVVGRTAEIGLIEALQRGRGIGMALVGALVTEARNRGCRTLRAITTNDNRGAQGFYLALGFRLVETRLGAVTESRRLKPQIPLEGADGTPIADELEFELPLEPAAR